MPTAPDRPVLPARDAMSPLQRLAANAVLLLGAAEPPALDGTGALTEVRQPDGNKLAGAQLAGLKPLVIADDRWSNPQGEGAGGVPVLGNHQGGTFKVDWAKKP